MLRRSENSTRFCEEQKIKEERVLFPDVLRIISVFFVVMIHVTSVGIREQQFGAYAWKANMVLNSIGRWAVPMFFMISGYFFLDPQKKFDIRIFYRKNVKRIVLTIVIAGFIYSIIDQYMYGNLSIKSIPIAIYAIVSDKSGYHLWFLYSLLMLYIATPILRIITGNADKEMLRYAVICWILFSVLVGQINEIAAYYLHIERALPYEAAVITQYSGYYLGGYYLKKYPIDNTKQRTALGVTAVIALILIPLLTMAASLHAGTFVSHFQISLGLGNLIICIAIFTFAPAIDKTKSVRIRRIIHTGGAITFYAYLIHVAVIDVLRNFIAARGTNSAAIIVISVVITAISYLLSYGIYIMSGLRKRN